MLTPAGSAPSTPDSVSSVQGSGLQESGVSNLTAELILDSKTGSVCAPHDVVAVEGAAVVEGAAIVEGAVAEVGVTEPRFDWTPAEALALVELPFHDLLYQAHQIHRQRFEPGEVEGAALLSIKTGACPEDCAYCPQSTHFETSLTPEKLMDVAAIEAEAVKAKEMGATRFCMGAAWRSPTDRQLGKVAEAVEVVAELGMETCVTLGMLTGTQAETLADAGLDYYNHNLDTSPEFYGTIITTRTYDDRLETLSNCRDAGLSLCTGGIVGMGESRADRAGLLSQLAGLQPHPESVPINMLIRIPGTPLAEVEDLEGLELVRVIAAARIMMPGSVVRLSAGREGMSEELHALSFFAGANSIFLGDKLLTADNQGESTDDAMLAKLGSTLVKTPLEVGQGPN